MSDESDPWPLRGGICADHGEYNNFSGRCLACDRVAAVSGTDSAEQ